MNLSVRYADKVQREQVQFGLNRALEIQRELKEWHINTVIAGGAARDILHCRVPKDYDLIVLGDWDSLQLQDNIEAAAKSLGLTSEAYGEGVSSSESPHISLVVKVGCEVDVIQQVYAPQCPEDVVANFDCTLNQVWLDGESGLPLTLPNYPKRGELVCMLPKCDDPANRSMYLSAKYPEYQWPYPPLKWSSLEEALREKVGAPT